MKAANSSGNDKQRPTPLWHFPDSDGVMHVFRLTRLLTYFQRL